MLYAWMAQFVGADTEYRYLMIYGHCRGKGGGVTGDSGVPMDIGSNESNFHLIVPLKRSRSQEPRPKMNVYPNAHTPFVFI